MGKPSADLIIKRTGNSGVHFWSFHVAGTKHRPACVVYRVVPLNDGFRASPRLDVRLACKRNDGGRGRCGDVQRLEMSARWGMSPRSARVANLLSHERHCLLKLAMTDYDKQQRRRPDLTIAAVLVRI